MESIFCVEQINVPPELGTIMKQYTKAILRDRPEDLYKYSANFFAALCGQAAPFDKDGHYVEQQEYRSVHHFPNVNSCKADVASPTLSVEHEKHEAVCAIFEKYDVNGDGRMFTESVPALLAELQKTLGLPDSENIGSEELMAILDVDDNGTFDLLEFRQLFFQSCYTL
ncbi:hypothetical protein ERJ75_000090200 [Trypanosoma vivax]|uniref:EF-hand domain-containing protein n=1 Tax=Trypanosoma vivax (strain Y486) TaxID=1055687 RepID=G0U8P2_TRYVY|nr:hypothetical protein TRVL_08389 [Trypanosoma vivax]KAH8604956.1 hypothetical protein ERJ75_001671800 [Trypanosoma vivax]KAH8620176.1 hypothetical protein ERJ75_000090200 [Trypanosoma vivax]CCC53969.1 conserved hypothetical protein [Trypanosoma vivax Y486]